MIIVRSKAAKKARTIDKFHGRFQSLFHPLCRVQFQCKFAVIHNWKSNLHCII